MKEFSIEEKAKRYDEALERAREYFKIDNDNSMLIHARGAMEYLFPELKESEDEKIRKEIIYHIKNCDDTIDEETEKRMLAWLEKQGEKEPIIDIDTPFGGKDSEFIDASYYIPEGFHAEIEGNNVVIKKGKQKPAWSEEDENKIKATIAFLRNPYLIKDNKRLRDKTIEWLLLFKERVQPQPKQELSEEDERITEIKTFIAQCNGFNKANREKAFKMLDTLRPQNSITDEELTQAKKQAYNDVLDKIEYHSGEPTFDDGWSAAIWYMKNKNAMPKNTWKPSKEQIIALRWVLNNIPYNKQKEEISGLLDQIKEL